MTTAAEAVPEQHTCDGTGQCCQPREVRPTCAEPSCAKELEKRLICSGCSRTPYCSTDCQKKHWKAHRDSCQAYQSGEIGYLAMKDMQTIVLSLGESCLAGSACCAFRLEKAENRARLKEEVVILKVKADPKWKKGEPRRIVLDSAETVPFAETQWSEGLRKMYDHANEAGRKRGAQHTMITMLVYGTSMAAPYASSAPDSWFDDLPEFDPEWKEALSADMNEIELDAPKVVAE